MATRIETAMKICSLLLPLVLTLGAVAQDHTAHAKNTSPAWEKMKTLVGTWQTKAEEGSATVTYQLVSGGTALMETVRYGKNGGMVTLYTPAGDAIALTHYCEAGNQPRMRARGMAGDEIRFDFVDVANLPTPETEFMRTLRIRFVDADHVQTVWTSHAPGKDTPYTFDLTRAKS
jgi:hypothetical protein